MLSLRDFRFALRSLARVPGFTLAVVGTLALGIGANTAIYSVVRGALLRPLPNRDGDRLVFLRQSAPGAGQDDIKFSVPEIVDFRTGSKALQGFGEYSEIQGTLVKKDEPARVTAGVITGNYFDVMGLGPVAGRLFDTRDDGAGAARAMVLTQEYWLRQFAGDPGVVGTTVRFSGGPITVVGVVQDAPRYPGRTDVFVNMVTSPHHMSATMITGRTHRMTDVFARLAPGATIDQARADINRIAANVHATYPETYQAAGKYEVTATPLHDVMNERATLTFWLLMGAAAFVFLIACANVANLALIRGIRRERELVVRRAMGAGAARLRSMLLAENLLLTVAGGVIGIGIAFAGLGVLRAFADQLTTRGGEIRLDGAVLGFTFASAIVIAIALAFVPHVGAEGSLSSSLATAGKRSTAGRGRQRLQRSLVVIQVAVSVVLLTGAGLLVRTLMKLQVVNPGVGVENVLTMEVPLDGTGRNPEQQVAAYTQMRDAIAALPGVMEVGVGSNVPLRGNDFRLDVRADGRALAPGEPTPNAEYRTISPEYLSAARIPLLRGRSFASTDRATAAPVVIVNQSLATRLFGDRDPIGQRIGWTGDVLRFIGISDKWHTIVGVVGDTRDSGPDATPSPIMFQPFAQEGAFSGAFVIRASADAATLGPSVVKTIRGIEPMALVEKMATLEQVRDEHVAPRRVNALLVASFGVLALVIAAVGIAGVLAFSVSSRTGEIGIRMSLGADSPRIQRMILGEGWALLAGGLVLGVLASLAAAQFLSRLLFGVTPYDPVTVTVVTLVMATVGTLACWLPALRAARVEPGVALRAE